VQQSSQAASEGNVSEALAAGTRAERQFEDAAEQLRRQTANQFTEEVEQLRESARQLESQQEKAGQAMRESAEPSPGLRPNDQSSELEKLLAEQRQRLRELTGQMQQTIRNAETAEPLLAQKLYDAYREAARQQVDQSLENTQQLLQNGLRQEAAEMEARARAGIGQLREDVEEAADAILGDEVEGLRRAAGTLAELADQLGRELEQFDGNEADRERSGDEAAGENSRDARRDADQPGEEGQQQPGESDRQTPGPGNESNRPDGGTRPGQSQSPSEEQRPEQEPGQRQGQGQGQGQEEGREESDGQDRAQAEGAGQSEGQGQGQGQSQGQQAGSAGQERGQGEGRQSANPQAGEPRDGDRRGGQGDRAGSGRSTGTERDGGGWTESFDDSLGSGPITGESFTEWSDRLRDVEEMISDAEIRSRAAQIRDRARSLRRDMRRRSEAPRWDLVRDLVATPLDELRQRVEQELVRRSGQREELVPVDRDPVPSRFEGRVRQYYEQLGQGR
jgi:hypothetical protein